MYSAKSSSPSRGTGASERRRPFRGSYRFSCTTRTAAGLRYYTHFSPPRPRHSDDTSAPTTAPAAAAEYSSA